MQGDGVQGMTALYDEGEMPLFGSPSEIPPLDDTAWGIMGDPPPDDAPFTVERLLYITSGDDAVPPDQLADLVTVLDQGGRIAVFALDQDTLDRVGAGIAALCGGSWA